jgi:hypothetical protein
MTNPDAQFGDRGDGEEYQYRSVFVLGGGWKLREWTSRAEAIEDLGVAKDKGAVATAIERKNPDTGQIERAQTPDGEWMPEEETDFQIRAAGEQ